MIFKISGNANMNEWMIVLIGLSILSALGIMIASVAYAISGSVSE